MAIGKPCPRRKNRAENTKVATTTTAFGSNAYGTQFEQILGELLKGVYSNFVTIL